MEAYFHILAILAMTGLLAVGFGWFAWRKLQHVAHRVEGGPPPELWKRATSIEPHLRPPVNGLLDRQVAIHVARRHHAPLPKEPGKLWR